VLVENNKLATKYVATKPLTSIKNDKSASLVEEQKKKSSEPVKKKTNSPFIFLSLLCIGLAVALAYTIYSNKADKSTEKNAAILPGTNDPLLQNISNARKSYSMPLASGYPVTVFDTLLITQDSLHLMGNGIILKGDSLYRGAGILISGTSRYILLDSLTIENFEVGIIAQNNNLELRNVQFINCRVPIEYQYLLPDTVSMNGRIPDLFISE
jgi:hypothetical protein